MKAFIPLLMAVGLVLVLAGCPTPVAFTGTAVPAATITAVATAANAAGTAPGLSVASITANDGLTNLTAGTTNLQTVTIVINGGQVDASSLGGVHFYNLTATAAADGGRTVGTEITPSSSAVQYSSSTQSSLIFSFDMNTAANFSNVIRLYIDPATLTANSGNKRLNRDGDAVMGEAADDDLVSDLAVVGGTKAVAAGNAASTQNTATFQGGFSVIAPAIGANNNVTLFTYAPATFAVPDNTDMKSILDAHIAVQTWNGSAWAKATYTTTYTVANGVYAISFTAAARDVYRLAILDPYNLASGKTINGYTRRYSFNQALTEIHVTGSEVVVADTPQTYSTVANASITAAVVFGSNGRNAVINVDFGASLGVLGLKGASTTTVRVYDTDARTFAPVSSVAVVTAPTTAAGRINNRIVITLNSAYTQTTGTALPAGPHAWQVQISPDVVDDGATTATTDDLKLGDYTNFAVAGVPPASTLTGGPTGLPYGWRLVTGTGGI